LSWNAIDHHVQEAAERQAKEEDRKREDGPKLGIVVKQSGCPESRLDYTKQVQPAGEII
jgi:Fe-S cluster assembly iron-binding protein IscA